MKTSSRKFALTIHLTVSIGWIGAVIAYLVLALAAITNQSTQMVRAAWFAMELIGWYAVVPMSIASLITGLIMSLGTSWGLFRHYWVLFSFVLTVFADVVLLVHMRMVNFSENVASGAVGAFGNGLAGEIVHAGGGLLLLLVVQVLNVYKPRGLTAYGWRKQAKFNPPS